MSSSRHERESGFTLIEVAIALSIITVIALGLVATFASSQKLETLKREQQLVQNALFARVKELRTLTTDEIRALNGATTAIAVLPSVTAPPTGSSAQVGSTFGDATIAPATLRLDILESDPNAPGTARADSGFFSVTATATWTGVLGAQSPQTMRVSSQVVSHAE